MPQATRNEHGRRTLLPLTAGTIRTPLDQPARGLRSHNGWLNAGERLASVVEGYEQWRAIRAVKYPHTILEISVIGSGGKVSLVHIVALAPRAKLLHDAGF